MASGGTEIERLHATVGVDLSDLRAGLAAAKAETESATVGMAGSFDKAATGIDAANRKIVASTGQAGRGMGMMGMQVGQLGTQLLTGTNAAVAFAQQLPDIAFGLRGTGGAAERFAGFMLGPWGTALTLAGLAVGLLAGNLWDSADAADDAKKAAEDLAEAEKRLANATAAANHQTRQGVLDDIARANSLQTRRRETLKTLEAEILLAKQEASKQFQRLGNARGEGSISSAGGQLAQAEGTIRRLEGQLAEVQTALAKGETAIRAGQRKIAERDAAAATDPTTAANQRLEDAQDTLARRFESGAITLDQYKAGLIKETRARDAAVEEIQESNRSTRSARSTVDREARARQRAINEAYRLDNAYQRALTTAQTGLLSAQQELADGYEERARIEREMAQARHDREEEEILTNRDYSDAQKGRLVALNDETHALRMRAISLDEARARDAEMEKRWEMMAEVQDIRRETELDLLNQQQASARTMEDRQRIALQIVRLEYDLAAARQREIIASANRVLASETATEAEKLAAEAAKARAEAMMEGLDAKLPGQVAAAKEANRTILDAEGFGRQLGDTLEEGILAALKGKNLKDAMRDGLFEFLNDATEEAFKNLSNVLFGEQGLGGFLGGLFSSLFGGARAVGGPVIGGMAYNVGNGERFIAPANGRILSRDDAMAAGGGGGRPFQLHLTISGARGNQEIMEMVRAGVQEGIGQYDRVVGSRVETNFRRRK